ncbi:hypothetical protein K6V98_03475 [Collinsella sp. AGMB00827]|uniref:Uncharacterized protein n=1 Tax=Collinsella ureilytica TaxID=2869515 RepID=A0ABS7MJI3_9ACTN|nr:hypothetical protein [Collinsella urealyticum]MBY4797422.1 hypothetical protein [Collinsella urealyticum]
MTWFSVQGNKGGQDWNTLSSLLGHFSRQGINPAPEEGSQKVMPPEVSIGETYEVQGYEVTVHSIQISRDLGALPLVPVEDMHLLRDDPAELDSEGSFLDDH